MKIKDIEITHPDKLIFPEDGITKLEVVKYYEHVADKMLPFLLGRPVSLVRSPAGIAKGMFYQKHPAESFPKYIERVTIQEKTESDTYITLDEVKDLIYLANYGVIEFHTWLASLPDLEHPDQLIIDIDPGSGSNWSSVIEAALFAKSSFEGEGLAPQLKVTGGKGLHVWSTLPRNKYTWEESKALAKSWAEQLVAENPDLYTINPRKDERESKAFLDYLRNERGATAVCAHSLRARPGAAVAMPVDWTDLDDGLKPNQFKLHALLE